jgi:hypothetical protein
MPTTPIEHYRTHEVWNLIELKRAALESVRYSQQPLEDLRERTIAILDTAARSQGNPTPVLFDDTLDQIRDGLNQLSADEQSFSNWTRSQYNELLHRVRDLPGPPPRQVNDRYLAALDTAVAARTDELQRLQDAIGALETQVNERMADLAQLTKEVASQRTKIAADSATISQVTSSADEQLRGQWETLLTAWEQERDARDGELDAKMAEQIRLLSTAALTGRRLVEQAAGSLTAADWAGRSKRERWNAHALRWASFAAFGLAVAVGAWVMWTAIDKDLALTVGDGILRGAVVLALAGIGSFLTLESRRHFREADSAEDVKLALTALEPYYAGSSDEERVAVRRDLGDTVFIKNTLSRFGNRDASKHSSLTNEQLNQVVDIIAKGAEVASKTGRATGSQ